MTRCDECGTEFSVLKMQLYKGTDKESICFSIWKNLGPIEEVAPVDLRLFDKSRVADFAHDVGDMDVWDLRPWTKPRRSARIAARRKRRADNPMVTERGS